MIRFGPVDPGGIGMAGPSRRNPWELSVGTAMMSTKPGRDFRIGMEYETGIEMETWLWH